MDRSASHRQAGVDPYLVGPSPEVLASHTIGWWRRQEGVDRWCDTARVALAHELALEATRRTVIERLDSIMRFLAAGAAPEQALYRLVDLVDELWPTAIADVLDATTDQKEMAA